MERLEPQAALETAALNLLLSPEGCAYRADQCSRMADGRPEPRCGVLFLSVWYDGGVEVGASKAALTALDEDYGVYVTVTVRCVLPFDRWYKHRDDVERHANRVRAALHADIYDHRVINAANELCDRRRSDVPDVRPVGFHRGMGYVGRDPIQMVGPDWFNAHIDAPGPPPVGMAQRVRFRGARLLQNLANME